MPAQKNLEPKVSIGLPVYNGESSLRQSIESLLAQDFADFELLISDNASTDRTWDICHGYAASDLRIRLHRHDKNVGAIANFEFVFANTTGPYFMWHAHDDLRDPSTLGQCVRFLDSNPHYILCSTANTQIDEQGTPLFSLLSDSSWDDDSPVSRVEKCFRSYGQCHAIYGLVRRVALQELLPIPRVDVGSDTIMVISMCLAGKCGQTKQAVRGFRGREFASPREALEHYPKALFGLAAKAKLFPNTRAFRVIIRRILHSDRLAPVEKIPLMGVALGSGRLRNFLMADATHLVKTILVRWEAAYVCVRRLTKWIRRAVLRG